ncbi:MAG: serine hydrolase, partial [Rhodospirillaceae bacterium]
MSGSKIACRIGSLLVTLAVCAACTPNSRQADYFPGALEFSPEIEAVYLERFELAQSRVSGDEIYIDREEISGAVDWVPLSEAELGDHTISDAALDAAEAYARSNDSSAFIVWRKGKVEREIYFEPFTRKAPVNSYSLSKPLAAFAVGRALEMNLIESLDQPVADFVNEWRGDSRREKILIRHLLDMRAGFLPQLPAQGPDD